MSGYPYGGSPVNIFQTPYSPQNEDLQRLMADFQVKYQQILQGVQPQYQQPQQQVQQVKADKSNNGEAENNQKMVLDYLYDVHGITPQQFQWEFEEYCNVIKEREQKLEQEIKQKVRDKITDSQQTKAESALSETLKREPAEPVFKEVQSKQAQPEVQQKSSGQSKGGYKKSMTST